MNHPASCNGTNAADQPAIAPDPVGMSIEAVQDGYPQGAAEKTLDQRNDLQTNKRVQLIKDKNGRFDLVKGSRLINNISWIVGFMELANAGDFAANVWNDVPVPVYAVVFMAIGGTVAGVLSIFAFLDARPAYQNVRFLRRQRRELQDEKARRLERAEPVGDLEVYLTVTFIELGSEIMARWLMDLLMGFGGVMISIGTYLAIGGADRRLWRASNILSGYLGNGPIALYGIANFLWTLYVFCEAQGRINATRQTLKCSDAGMLVKQRSRNVQVFCFVNGTATLMGGVGSMLTVTRWWGYVILIPVIFSSLFCNVWWRKRVGYTRSTPPNTNFLPIDPGKIMEELEFVTGAGRAIRENKVFPTHQFVADPASVPDLLAFLDQIGLLDNFCVQVTTSQRLYDALGLGHVNELEIDMQDLLALPDSFHPELRQMAETTIRDFGPQHFKSCERYSSELLGTFYNFLRKK